MTAVRTLVAALLVILAGVASTVPSAAAIECEWIETVRDAQQCVTDAVNAAWGLAWHVVLLALCQATPRPVREAPSPLARPETGTASAARAQEAAAGRGRTAGERPPASVARERGRTPPDAATHALSVPRRMPSRMKALALLALAASLVLPATAHAAPETGVPTPCDPMLLDFLCTIWQAVWRFVERVCQATWIGCHVDPALALP